MGKNRDFLVAFAQKEMGGDKTGHGFDHAQRVAGLAERIRSKEGGDADIIFASALLHDAADHKLYANIPDRLLIIGEALTQSGFAPEERDAVIDIIASLSWNGGQEKEMRTLEGKIVRDADRLDALGAIGLTRAIEYGAAKGRPFCTEKNLRKEKGRSVYGGRDESTLSHFYDKLLLLPDHMLTEEGKKIAKKRTAFLQSFLREFYRELDE